MHLDSFYALVPELDRGYIDYLICEILAIGRAELQLIENVSEDDNRKILAAIAKLKEGIPPQYIIGYTWFYGYRFKVRPGVLIPRFDTEVLIEALVKYLPESGSILDIGTGSGIIAITLKLLRPSLSVHATDISSEALALAKDNARSLCADVHLFLSDLLPEHPAIYSVIVSNPPYIDLPEYEALDCMVKDHEPRIALYGGEDGLDFYRRIANKASEQLCKGGILAFEHGCNQQKQVLSLTEKAGFISLQKGKDLAGRDRFLILQKRG